MIKVNSFPQELRLPTLPDEAKAPKSNPQPLDQYQETAPLLGDFGKFSSAETGNAILTNRVRLYKDSIAKGTDQDPPETPAPSTPDKPEKPPCTPKETTVTIKVGPASVTIDRKTGCPAPQELGPKSGQ